MITSLRLVNFKNFADETLRFGPFNLIVGANASGKSNIRDALRFLHGIGRGYTLAEIIGGKYSAGGYKQWDGIRGATNEIVRFGQDWFILEVHMKPEIEFLPQECTLTYLIEVHRDEASNGRFRVKSESLMMNSEKLLESGPPPKSAKSDQKDYSSLHVSLPMARESIEEWKSDQPVLNEIGQHFLESINTEQPEQRVRQLYTHTCVLKVLNELLKIRFLDLSPERMREPVVPGKTILGDSGDNLPAVLEEICADSRRGETLTAWLRELTPMDVKSFEFPRDPSGRIHLRIQEEDGKEFSAYSASDGTLRFIGMLAALLDEIDGGLYFFEEIDNGIHPTRLSLLTDLIGRHTAKGKVKVVATTHSPGLLDLIDDETFENTSLIYRDEDSADAVIRPVAELPNARELRKSQSLGRLHTSGWMENILSFAEAEREDEMGGE